MHVSVFQWHIFTSTQIYTFVTHLSWEVCAKREKWVVYRHINKTLYIHVCLLLTPSHYSATFHPSNLWLLGNGKQIHEHVHVHVWVCQQLTCAKWVYSRFNITLVCWCTSRVRKLNSNEKLVCVCVHEC